MNILLKNGYWAIVLISLFSILCLSIFLEKVLKYIYIEKKDFSKKLKKFKEKNKNNVFALDTINFNYNSSIHLANDLIEEYKEIYENDILHLEEKLKEIVFKKMRKMEEKLWILKITAALSPMIGLLGTVLGMMTAFESISKLGTGDSKIVAEGINGALITTAAGLIAAIPAMFFYNYLIEKNDVVIGDMKKIGLEIINNIRKRKVKNG